MATSRRCRRFAVVVATMAALPPATAWPQIRSTITGSVTDEAGAALAGAMLTIAGPNLAGGTRETVTDAQGVYRLRDLAPGFYDVTAACGAARRQRGRSSARL